jgi:predicted enzyme related to lactoylglutathione lyase
VIKDVHSAIIWTDDMGRLLPFYRDVLGLGTQMEADGFAVLSGGKLALGVHSEVKGAAKDPNRLMVNLSVDDCQAEYERLKGQGVKFLREPSEDQGGVIIATLADPDGNLLQLFQEGAG